MSDATFTRLETTLVRLPFPDALGIAGHDTSGVGCALVRLHTDDGQTGEGFAFTLDRHRLHALEHTIRSFEPLVIGRRPFEAERIWHDMGRDMNALGRTGVTLLAMAAIDTAVWDTAARTAGLPLHRLWGACRDEVDTYASGGLWLSTPVEALGDVAAAFVAQGYRAVKLRIGTGAVDQDVARVAAVREAVGPDVGLMVDANHRYTTAEAIRLGRALEEFGLRWFEDPIAAEDLVGLTEVRAAVSVPITAGETAFSSFDVVRLVDGRAVDIVMPDLQRIGGPSEFRRAAAVASSHHLPVTSHFFTEYSLSLAGAIEGMTLVEHIDWFAPLFAESPELVDGRLRIPDRPGTGFTFDPAAVADHRID